MALSDYIVNQDASSGTLAAYTHYSCMVQELKTKLIKRLSFQVLLGIVNQTQEDKVHSELRVTLTSLLSSGEYEDLSEQEKESLIQAVIDEIIGLGPLEPLLSDPEVSEIMVNGCQSLFYEKKGKLYKTEQVFSKDEQIRVVIDRILAPLGRRIDEQSPLVNARLPSGFRVNAVIAPIALDGSLLTIRKFSDRITRLSELVQLNSISQAFAQLLSWAVKARKNIAVVGGTGSGKTTLLNALSCEIEHDERIITIEDSAELKFHEHPHVVRLERRDSSIEGLGEVSIRDLVINSLRMRPDRIVVGECRGEETIDMLQAMNTGHDGSLTTLHAGSAEEAVVRLVLMSRYGIDLPSSVIEDQIATALDFIVLQKRLPDGSRKVSTLTAVYRTAEGKLALEDCVDYDTRSLSWKLYKIPEFVETLELYRIATKKEVTAWKSSW